ncbi:MAG: metallopeptidase family protein [Proteobacteria bacterium]|nr:metallopeptidase family protein [Pseudomonadota bacterium]
MASRPRNSDRPPRPGNPRRRRGTKPLASNPLDASSSADTSSSGRISRALDQSIDAGWHCLDAGDVDGAKEIYTDLANTAETAKGATERLAELWALGGAIAAAEGDAEAAVTAFGRATAADTDNARYFILSADVELAIRDDPETAIGLCDMALDVASDEDDLIDAVLLKSEALVSLGDRDDEAREVLAELEGCAIGDPLLLCVAGDLHWTLGDLDAARRAYRNAVELDPDWADGHHGLGMVHQARGEQEKVAAAWLRTRELDMTASPEPWHLSLDEFEEVAAHALAELPDDARKHLSNVPIFCTDAPSVEQVQSGLDPRLFGLFSGVPLPHKSHIVDGYQPHIDSIYLFQRNLERAAGSRERLLEEIRITVLHETAHFFGLEDADLESIGLG